MVQKKKSAEVPEEREFAVERQHLQTRLTVLEVEKREYVIDPLTSAPELPFGHLNVAWKDFLDGKVEGGDLWSFSARWQTTWGQKEVRSGYVLVKDDIPGAYFLTLRKEIQGEVAAGGR